MKVPITTLVAIHFLVTVWHWLAHASLGVSLPSDQDAFVFVVVILAPCIAGLLVWTRYVRIGAWTFQLSMLASFLFGAYHHFISVSGDNVWHLPNGSADARSSFIVSAAVLALVELSSALYGAFCLRKIRA